MQKLKKEFPIIDDFLERLKSTKFNARTQIFIISLIALHYERERRRGETELIPWKEEETSLSYTIKVRDKEITNKFKLSVDTIWRIREDLDKSQIKIKLIKVYKRGVKFPYMRMFKKQFDHEYEYSFGIKKRNRDIIKIPTSIIYDKNLTTKQKLSIIWNLSLENKLGRLPRLKEIEKESGISEKTIREAMKKYPHLFIKY